MAEVKWIKIVTDIFDDQKVRFIETMPNGDSIIVIWFKLLCLAGKCNCNGFLMMTDKIAYTDDILASIFNRDIKLVQLSLNTFVHLDMIEIIDNKMCLPNWEKHQNAERLNEIREQSRLSSAKHREKQQQLSHSVTDVSPTCHGDDTERDIDKEEDKELELKKETKHKFGEFAHVRLKDSEVAKLTEELGKETFDKCVKRLDEYIQETGKTYKDHNLTIRRWVVDAVSKNAKGDVINARTDSNEKQWSGLSIVKLG